MSSTAFTQIETLAPQAARDRLFQCSGLSLDINASFLPPNVPAASSTELARHIQMSLPFGLARGGFGLRAGIRSLVLPMNAPPTCANSRRRKSSLSFQSFIGEASKYLGIDYRYQCPTSDTVDDDHLVNDMMDVLLLPVPGRGHAPTPAHAAQKQSAHDSEIDTVWPWSAGNTTGKWFQVELIATPGRQFEATRNPPPHTDHTIPRKSREWMEDNMPRHMQEELYSNATKEENRTVAESISEVIEAGNFIGWTKFRWIQNLRRKIIYELPRLHPIHPSRVGFFLGGKGVPYDTNNDRFVCMMALEPEHTHDRHQVESTVICPDAAIVAETTKEQLQQADQRCCEWTLDIDSNGSPITQ
ncbi:hypothetical protein DFH07DRAFT_770935 [Mycena maculata]|uniref:Uncharacterized protein n=1 Tax=Mycena maculata TaxID=230809 RepID=A0AAD7NJ19_9AGAR|nr:hypothetical protein DFH07DRAFT_770935 [Mycena maculata]